MVTKKDDNPNTMSRAYECMRPRWDKINAVLGGTAAMRAAGSLFLPQHPSETDTAYRERLATSVLLNITQMTLDSWVGRPFSDPLTITEDVPQEIQELLEDVDLQGNAVGVF